MEEQYGLSDTAYLLFVEKGIDEGMKEFAAQIVGTNPDAATAKAAEALAEFLIEDYRNQILIDRAQFLMTGKLPKKKPRR